MSIPVKTKFKTVQFYGPKDLRYEDTDTGSLAPEAVLVKVEAALTGGTDVKTYLNGHPRIIKSLPSSFGYEFSGRVEKVGEAVRNFKPGQKVVAANTAPCYECFFCQKKEYSLCENLEFLNGSFAEYIKIPERIVKHNLYEIPENLSFEAAAMTQTLAVVLHGFYRSEIKDGDQVVVYGLGPIGQTFIKVLNTFRESGLSFTNDDGTQETIQAPNLKIIAIGRSETKRSLAKENGADYVLDMSNEAIDIRSPNSFSEPFLKELKEIAPYGADVVIEAIGKPEVWQSSFELVRKGGLINFFGGCPKGTSVELDTFRLHYDEVRTIGVFHHSPKYIKEALELLATNKIDLSNLISHEMKLSELEDALKLMISGEATKVLIRSL